MKASKSRRNNSIILPVLLLTVIFTTLFSMGFIMARDNIIANQNKNLDPVPSLNITLAEAPIEQIDNYPKGVTFPDNIATLSTINSSTVFPKVEIKAHGNTTWLKLKKPYQIKLSQKSSLLEMNSTKKWILLADYLDPTHLRNDTAFYIENLLAQKYALNGHHVNLSFDDNYHGLYYLSEKVEIEKTRIDLKTQYAVLAEIDNLHEEQDHITSKLGTKITFKDFKIENLSTEIKESFMKKYNDFEAAAKNKDFNSISNLIDVDSFAKYYLLSEFTANPDAYATSFFLYQDGLEDKIHVGPGWDYDIAFGSQEWSHQNLDLTVFYSPYTTMALQPYIFPNNTKIGHITYIPHFMYQLMEIPEFQARVKEIYQETLSGHTEDIILHIQNTADYIRPAALQDAKRWKLTTNFDEAVNKLIDWVTKRCEHFETTYGKDSGWVEATQISQDFINYLDTQ